MKVYGIKNCNTVKKAVSWLEKHKITHEFHDFKKEGIHESTLTKWAEKVGWQALVNKKGLTWRALNDEEKAAVTDAAQAIDLMQRKTSVIKRPIIESKQTLLVGFNEEEYESNLL